jgi:hypothetical protein
MVRIGGIACDRPLGQTRSPKGQWSSPVARLDHRPRFTSPLKPYGRPIALRSDFGRLQSSRLRSLRAMRPDELERQLRQRLDALGPAPRAELLHVLMHPDFERADRIGEFGVTRRVVPSPSS